MPAADLVEPPEAPTAPARPQLGLDRVLWQRLELRDGDLHGAVVAGVRHRRPASVRVDARTARELAAAGLPSVTRRLRSTP